MIDTERIKRRLSELEDDLREERLLRDHCRDWADQHDRRVHALEYEQRKLQEHIADTEAGEAGK